MRQITWGGRGLALAAALAAVASCGAGAVAKPHKPRKPPTPSYHGFSCPGPVGYTVAECRLGVHGTPDLSRLGWRQVFGREVTIGSPVTALASNPALGGAAAWNVVDSLGQSMGRLATDARGKFQLTAVNGETFRVTSINMRGHGCAASLHQQRTFALFQMIAPQAPGHGTQGFVSAESLGVDTPARNAFEHELGGGSGCGPAAKARGAVRPLQDPAVGAVAHARLGNGELNTVTEYDAKPAFGGTVYFMANTTSVHVGGVARGMVRVGTPYAVADRMRGCDPNSDGTLTWRYVVLSTGRARRPRLYGWIPTPCRAGSAAAAR